MPVPNFNLVCLFVKNPAESMVFYNRILDLKPVEESPTFVMYILTNGMMLGLWSHKTAEPPVLKEGGGSEICFNEENVDSLYTHWVKMGIPMVQLPTDMDFGRTFVAEDPDGHRIRVYRLREQEGE